MNSMVVGRDAERRIVDAAVVVLGSVEHDDRPFEGVGIVGVGQVARAELLADHAGLHDRGVEQVAAEHQEAGVRRQRSIERPDDPSRPRSPRRGSCRRCVRPFTVSVPSRISPCGHQLGDHRRHAAGAVVVLAEIFAGRLQVDQQRHAVPARLPVLERQLDADVAGDRGEVDRRVGRAADRRVDDDRVEEGVAGQDVRRLEVLARPSRRCAGRCDRRLPAGRDRARGSPPNRAATCRALRPALFIVVAVPIVLQ